MQQYREIKGRHQNAILFFRMGEFYEMFYDDAETASRVLGITLTSRNNGGAADVPLAGVPVKAAGDYVRRLVQQGFRVAICEQVEDPKTAKGVVRREVVETVTPGVAFSDDLLDGARNNFICACGREAGSGTGAGRRHGWRCRGRRLDGRGSLDSRRRRRARSAARASFAAGDSRAARRSRIPLPASRSEALVTEREAWEFDEPLAREDLARQYGVLVARRTRHRRRDALAVGAAGALLRYLRELQPGGLPQLARPIVERPGGVMPLDEMTRRNLELVESLRGGGVGGHAALACSIAPARRWARDCCVSGCSRRSRSVRRSTRGWTRWRRSSPIRSRATRCATPSTTFATSSVWRQRPRRGAARRASCARSAIRSPRLPAVARPLAARR